MSRVKTVRFTCPRCDDRPSWSTYTAWQAHLRRVHRAGFILHEPESSLSEQSLLKTVAAAISEVRQGIEQSNTSDEPWTYWHSDALIAIDNVIDTIANELQDAGVPGTDVFRTIAATADWQQYV